VLLCDLVLCMVVMWHLQIPDVVQLYDEDQIQEDFV